MRLSYAVLLILAALLDVLAQNEKTHESSNGKVCNRGTPATEGPVVEARRHPDSQRALHTMTKGCERRLSIVRDALFNFDKTDTGAGITE